MFKLTQTQDNAIAATHQYLKAIGAKVTAETVEDTLKNHPDYPSLLAHGWQNGFVTIVIVCSALGLPIITGSI